jgi:hypothetical protein
MQVRCDSHAVGKFPELRGHEVQGRAVALRVALVPAVGDQPALLGPDPSQPKKSFPDAHHGGHPHARQIRPVRRRASNAAVPELRRVWGAEPGRWRVWVLGDVQRGWGRLGSGCWVAQLADSWIWKGLGDAKVVQSAPELSPRWQRRRLA